LGNSSAVKENSLKGEGMKKFVPMLTLSLAVVLGSSTLSWAADDMAPAAPASDSSAAQPGSAPAPAAAPAPVKKQVHKKKHVKKHKKVHKAPAKEMAPAAAPGGDAAAPAEGGAGK
jgi:hypothetical protein